METIKNSQEIKERRILQESHHKHYLWTYYSVIVIGLWMLTGFSAMGYEQKSMIINDIVCGALLVILGFLSLNPFRIIAQWAAGMVGFWLCLAPLVFHAESAVAYTTNTLAGILVMSFVFIIPNIPGIKLVSYEGPNVPPGWSYNPSSWSERIPVVFLGWAGFFTARYLAGYQMGYSDNIWDPFFGDGTVKVLTSDVSKGFPVSDAGLGAFAYLLDVIMGLAGRTARWRTMPWVVLIFGFLVIPLGIVSTTLIILQPLSVGSWCSACLLSALITVAMIPFTFDEVLASVQYLGKKRKEGYSLWKVFWFGGDSDEGNVRHYRDTGNRQVINILKGMWGDFIVKPWNLFVSIIMGLWFMLSPGIFNYEGGLADSNHIVGAIVVTISIIVMSEVVRTGRFLNILCGLWLLAALILNDHPDGLVVWTQIIAAVILIASSIRKGPIIDKHGGFNQYIK